MQHIYISHPLLSFFLAPNIFAVLNISIELLDIVAVDIKMFVRT